MKKIIVAIDGFSSSGKSTMARRLAAAVGYKYIDSGAMYRAVTLWAMRHGLIKADGSVDVPALEAALPGIEIDFAPDAAAGTNRTLLNGEDVEDAIRGMEVASHVSEVAAIPAVRHYLTAQMQRLGKQRGIVMDGRDIGSTVFPDAEMKVFVDASPQVRARRRYNELVAKGQHPDFDEVLANVEERDRIDSTRKESPLRRAKDAVCLCNDDIDIDEQDRRLLKLFHSIAGE